MELAEIIKALAEVGVLIICAAVVIWQVIKDSRQKDNEKEVMTNAINTMINTIKGQNDMMLNQIIQKVDTGHLVSPEEDKNISKIEKELEKILEDILSKTGANRVAIFRYHNGGKDYNGRSFLRMSMTNEVVKFGTAMIQHQSQNLFRSMFFKLTNNLEDSGKYYISNIEDIKEDDPGLYDYLKNLDIKAKYSIALYKSEFKVIGYLSLYFADKDNVNEQIIEECFNETKLKIETLLNL